MPSDVTCSRHPCHRCLALLQERRLIPTPRGMPSVSSAIAAHATPCSAVQKSGSRARLHLMGRLAQNLHRSVGIAAPRSRCLADQPLPSGVKGRAEPPHRETSSVGLLPLKRNAGLAAAAALRRHAASPTPQRLRAPTPPKHGSIVGIARPWSQRPGAGVGMVVRVGRLW